MEREIILIGGGGHCKSCIDVIEQQGKYSIAGIIDNKEKLHHKVFGYEIVATDEDLPDLIKDYKYYLVTLGQIKNPDKRIKLFNMIKNLGGSFPIIISPFAYVSRYATIGSGTIVMHHAVLNAGSKIGQNCIINSKVLIEHDVFVGDYCHIATGAIINGGVKVGQGTFWGSGTVSKEYIEIGERVVIASGQSLWRDVISNTVVFNQGRE